jgi:hypothetical protein
VTSGTLAISDSDSGNGSDEEEEIINVGLGGVSGKFVWQIYTHFPHYEVYGLQFDTTELDAMSAYENIFYIAPLVQLIVDEISR